MCEQKDILMTDSQLDGSNWVVGEEDGISLLVNVHRNFLATQWRATARLTVPMRGAHEEVLLTPLQIAAAGGADTSAE